MRSESKLIVIFMGVCWPAWTTSSSPACRPRGRCGLPAPVTAARSPFTPARCCCRPSAPATWRCGTWSSARSPRAAASRAGPSPPRSASSPRRCRGSAPATPSTAPGDWPARWAGRGGRRPREAPPADPQPRPAAAGPPVGTAGPHPRRDRPQAGRVPVPDLRADQATRHAASPRPPVRGHRGRGRRHRPGRPRRRTDRAADAGGDAEGEGVTWRVAARIETGTVACRYAGAMLVHAFTDRIGARGLLSAGTGTSAAGAGALADDLGILVSTQMSFTLGALTIEQTKHLAAADAGALAGLTSLPSLRTWRQRLGELADTCDPLALQRRLASQMLAIEPAESQVYLADDHIAEYTGHQAVALGRNPRRGKPTKGHDDTYICDLAGRAIAFTTGEPSALCTTLPGALA